ncbi:Hypothetical Protein FCC1311_022512 [Hondaea fermentalgiana]|uniref:Flavin reductase like domain-containing protein n=1 Tax=Hondaea fermentalgiana TaxID=2315210 RepID=A0A2R5GCZ2_9STRA|nr:Hypothetical Protein FCC1311_022512 [Hondaea fermentalgiana]|eukprot:GBG26031.1 Hypothetical Protein FCC1311_022512 [Hondaea fermentalgiana]
MATAPHPDEEATAADGAAMLGPEVVRLRQAKLQSRVLYANPVCMLVTEDKDKASGRNVNNDGLVMLSLNRRRYSCGRVLATRKFELAVAGADLAPLLLRIGKVTGRDTDKFVAMEGVDMEWRPVRGETSRCELVKGSIARVRCHVVAQNEDVDAGHVVFFAQIDDCLVNADAWNGKQFMGPCGLLSFLGSQEFALVKRFPDADAEKKTDAKQGNAAASTVKEEKPKACTDPAQSFGAE